MFLGPYTIRSAITGIIVAIGTASAEAETVLKGPGTPTDLSEEFNLDNSWTSRGRRIINGSQVISDKALASGVTFKAERTGDCSIREIILLKRVSWNPSRRVNQGKITLYETLVAKQSSRQALDRMQSGCTNNAPIVHHTTKNNLTSSASRRIRG